MSTTSNTPARLRALALLDEATEAIARLTAERDALRKDAARWQHVWQCVRIGQHGEYVLMPDDPTGLAEDSIVRSSFPLVPTRANVTVQIVLA